MLKFVFVTIGSLLISLCVFSQSMSSINPNQILLSLQNSAIKNSIQHNFGEYRLKETYSLEHTVFIHYSRILNSQLSISAGGGAGFQGFNYNLAALNGFCGTENYYYWQKAVYNIFYQAEIFASYYLPVNRADKLKFSIGGGFLQLLNTGSGISSYSELGEDYRIKYEYPNQLTPIAIIKCSYVKVLKNKNEIELGINCDKSFKDVYFGNYKLHHNTSGGKLSSTGTNVGMQFSYVFTGNQNKIKLNEKVLVGENSKLAKQELRRERRYLDPNSTFLSVSCGTGICINKVDDEANHIGNSRGAGLLYGIEYEHGIGNNFLFSGGINISEYYYATRIVYNNFSSGSNAFWAYEFKIGGGYRWITESNLKLLNIYTGIVGGWADIEKDYETNSTESISSYSSSNLEPDYTIEIISNTKRNSNFICAAYLGVSKDFRISNLIYFSLNYRYQHGFVNILESEMIYSTNQFEGTLNANRKIDGSTHQIYLALKLRFR